MISSKLMESRAKAEKEKDYTGWFRPVEGAYKRSLNFALGKKLLVVVVSLAIFVGVSKVVLPA
jgi:multidrug efflux pump subunit AcrB